jgi:hypothetical protein
VAVLPLRRMRAHCGIIGGDEAGSFSPCFPAPPKFSEGDTTVFENMLKVVAGVIAAFTAVVIGLTQLGTALGTALRPVVTEWVMNRKNRTPVVSNRLMKSWPLAVGLTFIVLSVLFFPTPNMLAQAKPLNVRLTSEAWDAFNAKNWKRAISKADECIKEFQGHADEMQAELEKAKAPQPPDGAVSEQEKKQIFKLGLINDVATCLWIKARASQELDQKEEAKQAYQAAAKYTYGRSWDPNGWFWNPSQDAFIRLKRL